MITIRNLSRAYDGGQTIGPFDLDVPKGRLCGLIGPNGSGKSTLLRLIAGFEQPDSGTVSFDGKPLRSISERRAAFAFLPESVELYPELRAGEFLSWWSSLCGSGKPDEGLVQSLRLDPVFDKRIGSLSKGYRQRLKLFAVLSIPRTLYLLDEPLDGFDLMQLREIVALLHRKRDAGSGFLVSIHQLGDAEKLCDYFILVNAGRVVACGTHDELREGFAPAGSLEEIFESALK